MSLNILASLGTKIIHTGIIFSYRLDVCNETENDEKRTLFFAVLIDILYQIAFYLAIKDSIESAVGSQALKHLQS